MCAWNFEIQIQLRVISSRQKNVLCRNSESNVSLELFPSVHVVTNYFAGTLQTTFANDSYHVRLLRDSQLEASPVYRIPRFFCFSKFYRYVHVNWTWLALRTPRWKASSAVGKRLSNSQIPAALAFCRSTFLRFTWWSLSRDFLPKKLRSMILISPDPRRTTSEYRSSVIQF